MNDSMLLEELVKKYKSACTVPKRPKKCPDCQSKVGIYHINYEEAVFMCSNENCVWPLATHQPEQICGRSDARLHNKIIRMRKRNSDTSFDLNESSLSEDSQPLSPKKHVDSSKRFHSSGNLLASPRGTKDSKGKTAFVKYIFSPPSQETDKAADVQSQDGFTSEGNFC